MSITGGIVVYVIIWWLVLFMVLPFGVQSQLDVGDVQEGTAPSAPVAPRLVRKMLITSVIAAVLWTGFYLAMVNKWVTLDSFPI